MESYEFYALRNNSVLKCRDLGMSWGESEERLYCGSYQKDGLRKAQFLTVSNISYHATHELPNNGYVRARSVYGTMDEAIKKGRKSIEDFDTIKQAIYEEFMEETPDKEALKSLGLKDALSNIRHAWICNKRPKVMDKLPNGWDMFKGILKDEIAYAYYADELSEFEDSICEDVNAYVRFSIDNTYSAGDRLINTYHVPEWSVPLYAIADYARMGVSFQTATDVANMDRRLAGKSANGNPWKGNPRAERFYYLMYIDRIVSGRSKSRNTYLAPPNMTYADIGQIYDMLDGEAY